MKTLNLAKSIPAITAAMLLFTTHALADAKDRIESQNSSRNRQRKAIR
jgi:hypothetical protein